jgi:signal transduction histidine kinase
MPWAAEHREFETLSKVIEVISSESDLSPLLDRILQHACELIGADDGTIGMYDGSKRVVRTAAVYRMPARELGAEMALGQGLAGRVLASGKRYCGRYGDLSGINLTELSDSFVAGVPILWQGVLLGVFGIGVRLPRVLDLHAVQLLELLARHAAIAIHNVQRYQQERQRAARFELVIKVAAMLQRDSEIMTILQGAADAIHTLLEYQNVDIPLIEAASPEFLTIAIRGGSYKNRIQQTDHVPIAGGIMGAAVRTRKSQLVNDVANDLRYVTPPGVTAPKAELAVPILRGEEVLGVLNVEGNSAFTYFDQQCLELIADHLALAIANARLHDQARYSAIMAERYRLASELHDNVTQLVSSISLLTQSLPQSYRRSVQEGEQRAQRIHTLAQTAYAELRNLLHELSPPERSDMQISRESQTMLGLDRLQSGGLGAALTQLLPTLVPESLRLELRFDAYVMQELAHEEALYRVCQEAVSNVIRHAKASRIWVEASVTSEIVLLKISDDGKGMNNLGASKISPSQGLGMSTMRTRMSVLGGALRLIKRQPNGAQVEAALPRKDRVQ